MSFLDSVRPSPAGSLPCFDVALWRRWSCCAPASACTGFPEYVAFVEAASAFAAIEALMRFFDLSQVAYACAFACDGSLMYRCYQLRLLVVEKEAEVVFS